MAKRKSLPTELENVAYVEDVNAIHEKVEKCYSKERYEDFQGAVEKIISRYLKSVVGWGVFIWLVTLIGSMLLQKFFSIF
jgi:hypothetical protein